MPSKSNSATSAINESESPWASSESLWAPSGSPWAPFMRIKDLGLSGAQFERDLKSLELCKDQEFQYGMTPKEHLLLQISNVLVYQSQTGIVARLKCLNQYMLFHLMSTFVDGPVGPHSIDAILHGATLEGMSREEMLSNVDTYIQYGGVLIAMIDRLGWGCLRYLVDYLSDDFLSSDPMSAGDCDKALKYLNDLNHARHIWEEEE